MKYLLFFLVFLSGCVTRTVYMEPTTTITTTQLTPPVVYQEIWVPSVRFDFYQGYHGRHHYYERHYRH